MLFTSYTFILFLAVLTAVYYLFPGKAQPVILLLGSCLFYAWARPSSLVYILTTSVTVWAAGLLMGKNLESQGRYLEQHKEELTKELRKAYRKKRKAQRRVIFLVCLLFNLGILAVIKYSGFAEANINAVLKLAGAPVRLTFLKIALPMGISFYTFMAVGYLIDVYRETVPAEKNLLRFTLFVTFFPQVIQGPISRYGDLSKTLYSEHRFQWSTVSLGLQRILWGFFKKLVIADRVAPAVAVITGDTGTYNGAWTLVLMLLYTLELYADFTGGIDITIGVAQMLGITLQENFIRPFFSKSLKEYWRRWHITMGTWFRDYIFYPMSVSSLNQKLMKLARKHFGDKAGRRIPVYFCSFAVWLATGIWHGPSWNFVAWGLLNWVILTVSEELEPQYAKFHSRFDVRGKTWYRAFQVLRTFSIILVLKVFDCYTSLADIGWMFVSLFTVPNWNIFADGSLLKLGLALPDYAILAAGTLLMFAVSMAQRRGSVRSQIAAKPWIVRTLAWYLLFTAVLVFGAYGIGYDASQFIYNRF